MRFWISGARIVPGSTAAVAALRTGSPTRTILGVSTSIVDKF
jgi:hypothetical protein